MVSSRRYKIACTGFSSRLDPAMPVRGIEQRERENVSAIGQSESDNERGFL